MSSKKKVCSCFAHSAAECICGAWPSEVERERERDALKEEFDRLKVKFDNEVLMGASAAWERDELKEKLEEARRHLDTIVRGIRYDQASILPALDAARAFLEETEELYE